MQLIHFSEDGNSRIGVKTDRGILDLAKTAKALSLPCPAYIDELVKDKEKLAQVSAILEQADERTDASFYVSPEDITFLPVLSHPGKIICVGKNYKAHVAETKSEIPKEPVIFSKFKNALAAHKEPIHIPPNASKVDYEAELVVVIGATVSQAEPADALKYVAGYTVGNDVSARDWQHLSSQWLLGKTADKFAPIGPIFTTADEVDPSNLDISLKLNGEVRQNSNTKHFIFDIPTIISYVSKHFTLEAGDIIFTGTPDGVILGHPKEDQVWLKAGDTTEITIEGLGTLINTFK
jgi:2-keto-4-pentenoate hydratase/2-oxohepta-3-ene-1,7-dioic acid hydratase in catechol pathway